ncbi:methylenetetrahydrofolate reductase [Sphingomonas sp. 28-63-12]|uniref:methylenetetrahydrofolate reductase n=1 Tax=Sphingomonas sp. 28-63-12 TaxID=1970434 RepID=UPI0035A943A6
MNAPAAILRDSTDAHAMLARLFDDASLEMTAKDIEQIDAMAARVPAGTMVSVTFLPGESFASRIDAAAAVHRRGLKPVPHLSARRLTSAGELEGFLDALAERIELRQVFVVAGDLAEPAGPYHDALAVIRSGLLEKYGVRHVGIAGYPQGHPGIDNARLWRALADKDAELTTRGLDYSIMTQFGFDAVPILDWLAQLRATGIDKTVRVGVAGPASVKALLRFAARCGVGASAKVMQKYGLSLTKLLGAAGPDPILDELAAGLDRHQHGDVSLHFYPFGGLTRTADWIAAYRAAHRV